MILRGIEKPQRKDGLIEKLKYKCIQIHLELICKDRKHTFETIMNKKAFALLFFAIFALPTYALNLGSSSYDSINYADYQSGLLVVSTNYNIQDIPLMAIDLVGYILQTIIDNAPLLVQFLVLVIILGLVVTLISALFAMMKGFGRGRR